MTGLKGNLSRRVWMPAAMATFLMGASPAWATPVPLQGQEREVTRCVRQAARGRLWLERTLWGLRDKEAGWIGAEVRNTNGTHDLGPLQINSWWVPRIARLIQQPEAHVRYWLRFDPCFNAEVARWIFLSGLRVTGNYWDAIGIYHSPTEWRGRAYAREVAAHLRGRFGSRIFGGSGDRDATRARPSRQIR